MKAFWIIIGFLAALTAVAWFFSHRPKALDARTSQSDSAETAETPNKTVAPKQNEPAAIAPVIRATPTPETPIVATARGQSQPDDDAAELMQDLQASYDARPDSEKGLINTAIGGKKPRSATAAVATTAPATQPGDESISEAAATRPASDADADADAGPKIDYELDGSMIVDDQFTVRGTGTDKRPYRIPWELLVSAEETYLPRQDMYELPKRLSYFDGKPIQITGYVFSALYRGDTSELMVMQNMWDGCCIGEPPTPYDAIEVKLKEPISLKDLPFICIGVLRGTLRVDPYVKDGWLLGLYVVDDATIQLDDL